MNTTLGVDYPWTHPSPAALKAAGVAFAMRYLATDRSKALSRAEADALAAVGIWVGVVWETTADRMLSGRAGGVTDAKAAAAQASACGMPSGRPIYFAADWDVTPTQQAAVNAYLDGAASVLGRPRVGVYGGYYTVKRALDGGHATWAWQTPGWSGGQWDARAHIRQGAQRSIGGVSCDLNTAMKADFGQWMPGKTPSTTTPQQEQPMSLPQTDLDAIAHAVASYSHGDDPDVHQTWQDAATNSGAAVVQARTNGSSLSALTTKVDALLAKVETLGAGAAAAPAIDYTKLAAALIAQLKGN